jgi:hypothetical protein
MNDKSNSLPGFTAGSSLYGTSDHYYLNGAPDALGYRGGGSGPYPSLVQLSIGEWEHSSGVPLEGDGEEADGCICNWESRPQFVSNQAADHYRQNLR